MAIQTDILQSNLAAKPIVMQDSNGVEVMQGCTAWVNFDPAGTILDSFNVSSVTHTSAGSYTITFTMTMKTVNYVALATSQTWVAATKGKTLSSVSVAGYVTTSGALLDQPLNVAIFGGK